MSGNFDGITILAEVSPVEGYNPLQQTKGYKIANSVTDKLLSIPNEQMVGQYADWVVSSDMEVVKMRVSLGIASATGSVTYTIRKNGTQIGTITVHPGVLVQNFLASMLNTTTFDEGDVFRISVSSTNSSMFAYHLTFQLDYKLR